MKRFKVAFSGKAYPDEARKELTIEAPDEARATEWALVQLKFWGLKPNPGTITFAVSEIVPAPPKTPGPSATPAPEGAKAPRGKKPRKAPKPA